MSERKLEKLSDLLSEEEHRELRSDLARMADMRRRAAANAANMIVGSGSN